MKLPTLYKSTKTGAVQVCDICVEGNEIITVYGQLNGSMQISKDVVTTGKNIGKANETTPEQQAELEAQSKWNRKVKSGYSKSITSTPTVGLPMKVKSWTSGKLPPKVNFPLYATIKYNGVNGTFKRDVTNGTLVLYSRGGDQYPMIPHLEEPVCTIMDLIGSNELNCELYCHGEHLQDITAAVKKHNDLTPKLSAVIFDISDSDLSYEHRRSVLANSGLDYRNEYIKYAIGRLVYSHEDLESYFNQAINDGYEGIVIKHPDALYEHNVRSNRMWKYKPVLSAEYQVTGYSIDRNGHPVWELTTGTNTFRAKPKGTHEQQTVMASKADEFIGKWATVEYETLSKDGKPLKPIFVTFRKCDDNGEPIE